MSARTDVARCKTPREAILLLADLVDDIYTKLEAIEAASEWDSWGDDARLGGPVSPAEGIIPTDALEAALTDAGPPMGSVEIIQGEGRVDFVFPEPSDERKEHRRLVERQQLKLTEALGEEADWTEAYVKGGPWWLYQHRRDLVMGYPEHTRRMMVDDVEQDSPKLAYEMSLDVLKQPAGEPDFENGAGALAVGNVTTKSVRR